jgi:hypothetical protein
LAIHGMFFFLSLSCHCYFFFVISFMIFSITLTTPL